MNNGQNYTPPDARIDETWLSPIYVFSHIIRVTEKFGLETINKQPRFMPVVEARLLSITALTMYALNGMPTYLQLCKEDPPDAFTLHLSPTQTRTRILSVVEHTSYRKGAKESLLQQLIRTKKISPDEYRVTDHGYVLVVDLLMPDTPDEMIEELRKYLVENNIKIPVWVIKSIQLSPDTIGEVVIVNPETVKSEYNFGLIAHHLKQELETQGLPLVLKVKKAKTESQIPKDEMLLLENYSEPPWDKEIEK